MKFRQCQTLNISSFKLSLHFANENSPESVLILCVDVKAILHKSQDWPNAILYLVWKSCVIMSQAILFSKVCEIWCFVRPKIDPAEGSLVKSSSFIFEFYYTAFSLKSLCSVSCFYSCSWHTGSVLGACGMSFCSYLRIG